MYTGDAVDAIPYVEGVERVGRPSRRARLRRSLRRSALSYVLLTPFLILFAVFFIVPLVYAFGMSLFTDRLIGGTVFVGAANYLQVLSDDNFWDGVRRVAVYGVVAIPIGLGLALVLALLLDSGVVPFVSFFRLAYFLPYAVPSVIAVLMWGYLYGPMFGPFTQIAQALRLPPPPFLSDQGILPSIANISFWLYTGSNMIIFFAALKSIPLELYDAAIVDGATRVHIAWHIKVPLIAPALTLMLILSIIGTLQMFVEPQLLQPLAPGTISSHFTPNLYAYNLVGTGQQFNYVAALSFTLGGLIMICSALGLGAIAWNRRRQVP